ncbi:hypothetical protein Strvi_4810 [Streptomyces violaceusniger Tu 4113]|uniref:Uncharacterized protein n=2 Tax=Streptomyces violaceusniger TaxID=68280 RepID=G2P3N6_STRV4|nr:hypothetical protein Strvi_4810 [Streptomyces violaceusniger Tu 4113]
MRNDDTRFTVNRAQFDNSEETREKIRDRVPAVRKIEHTIEYLGSQQTLSAVARPVRR